MTPAQYKARYENLVIPRAKGEPVTVNMNQYRLRTLNYNEAAAHAFLNRLDRSGVDVELTVDSGPETFRIGHRKEDGGVDVHDMTRTGPARVDPHVLAQVRLMARYVFAGKGAPEHCQIVLQLADHWNLAPAGLQAYADKALGLDCNGFVGNYLWHVKRGRPWTDQGLDANEGPDSTISQYFTGKHFISHWEDMKPGLSYIFGKVNAAGAIIEGGGASATNAGHIAITEPSHFRPAGDMRPPAVHMVESTIAHQPGLCESWYSPISMSSRFAKVFNIHREAMIAGHQQYPFKIAAVH
jgi:hypothetical protein